MKALMSPLARRMLAAGIKIIIGKPILFEGKWYTPTRVPKAERQRDL